MAVGVSGVQDNHALTGLVTVQGSIRPRPVPEVQITGVVAFGPRDEHADPYQDGEVHEPFARGHQSNCDGQRVSGHAHREVGTVWVLQPAPTL